jgi:hypothetical protein
MRELLDMSNTGLFITVNFRGSISGSMLVVTDMLDSGKILPGDEIVGHGIANNTRIGGQFRGETGRKGVYLVTPPDQSTANIVIAAR